MRARITAMLAIAGCGPIVDATSDAGGDGESTSASSAATSDPLATSDGGAGSIPGTWTGVIEITAAGIPEVRIATYRVLECGDAFVSPSPRCSASPNWHLHFEINPGVSVPGIYASEDLSPYIFLYGPPRGGDDDDCWSSTGWPDPFTIELDAMTANTLTGRIVDLQTGLLEGEMTQSGPFVAHACP